VKQILQTGFFSSPERTSPAAYARVILRVHLSPGPGKAYWSGLIKNLFFLTWVPGRRRGHPVHRERHCTNSRFVASQISTRRDSVLVLRQQTRSVRIFLHSPYTLLTRSLPRRIESGDFNFIRILSGDFNSVRVLDLATDIVTAESNESHFAVNTIACSTRRTSRRNFHLPNRLIYLEKSTW